MESVKVVHAIPGRVRLRVHELKGNPGLASAVQERLAAAGGIRWVEVNAATGSVLVFYEPETGTSPGSLRTLSEALTPLFPALDLDEVEIRLPSQTNGSNSGPSLDERISGFFGTINFGVGKATGGIDLKVLLPVALFALGIRGLLVSEKLPFPQWYDLLWFAFGTFLALHPIAPADAP